MRASSCLHGRPRNLLTPEEGNGFAIFTRSRNRANLRAPLTPSDNRTPVGFHGIRQPHLGAPQRVMAAVMLERLPSLGKNQ